MSSVPILYYHSVANHENEGDWTFLSCPISVFEAQMEYLAKQGWSGVHYSDLEAHLAGERPLPPKSLMLQFDDGFLDNWCVVHPILERLNLKYVVLVSRDFIDPSIEARPQLRRTEQPDSHMWWGYLNASEMHLMVDSGLCDFQAHAGTHTWYEAGPKLLGSFADLDGQMPLVWKYWNAFPEKKSTWLTSNWRKDVDSQSIILEHKKSLEVTRFFPSDEYKELLSQGCALAEAFDELGRKVERLGHYESSRERLSRLKEEMSGIKNWLECELGKPVIALVWPGGGQDAQAVQLAAEIGYRIFSKGTGLNSFGDQRSSITRLSGTLSRKGRLLARGQQTFLRFQLLRGRSAVVSELFDFLRSTVKGGW
jgi:peptidoglycan/xylan/chitin deacetylase (PgdA/CDA1 family)